MSPRSSAVLALFCALLIMTLAASCAPAGTIGVLAQSSIPRNTSPQVASSELSSAAGGVNAFGLDLHRALVESEQVPASGNLFFSPYSISTALAMAYGGARGETERQMAATLHYELPQTRRPEPSCSLAVWRIRPLLDRTRFI